MSTPENAAAAETHRIPAPAPLPDAQTGKHATDSQNVRRLDAEDIKSHGLDPAASKMKKKTAPRSSASPAISRDTPVNDLRMVSMTLPRQPARFPEPNWFIPCFGMMFHILATMNDKVCSLRPFAERGSVNTWCPQVSVLVFSVLAIVQTLRASNISRYISPEQLLFLDAFLSRFPLETIEIPGPLVPFFRSLSVASPGFGDFADCSPILPQFTFSEERLYRMDFTPPAAIENACFTGINTMVPHVPLMVDQFVHLIRYILSDTTAVPRKYAQYEPLRKIFGFSYPPAGDRARTYFETHRMSIGFWHRPTASNGLMARFAAYISNASRDFPSPWIYDQTHAGAAADPQAVPPTEAVAPFWSAHDSFFEYMFMATQFHWFATLLSGMHEFNRHWKGNQRMVDISPLSSTAGLVLFKQVSLSPIAAVSVFDVAPLSRASHRLIFNTSAIAGCPYITAEDFEDAQVAQVNIACDDAFGAYHIGDIGVTRGGSYWAVHPPSFTTDRGDLTPSFQAVVASLSYFQE